MILNSFSQPCENFVWRRHDAFNRPSRSLCTHTVYNACPSWGTPASWDFDGSKFHPNVQDIVSSRLQDVGSCPHSIPICSSFNGHVFRHVPSWSWGSGLNRLQPHLARLLWDHLSRSSLRPRNLSMRYHRVQPRHVRFPIRAPEGIFTGAKQRSCGEEDLGWD